MLTDAVQNLLPPHYAIQRSEWYINLFQREQSFKYLSMLVTLIFAMLIPISFITEELILGKPPQWLANCIAFGILAYSFLAHVQFKGRSTLFYNYLYVLYIFATLFGLLVPNSRNISQMLFFSFPFFSITLKGRKKSLPMLILLPTSMYLLLVLYRHGYIPFLGLPDRLLTLMIGLSTYFIISLSFFLLERNRDSVIAELVQSQLYDSKTGIPNRSMLASYTIDGTEYDVLLIAFLNHHELTSISGYEAFDDYLADFGAHLQEFHPNNVQIFRLANHELAVIIQAQPNREARQCWYQQLHAQLTNLRIENAIGSIAPILALGVSSAPTDDLSSGVSRANLALSYALENRRRLCFFDQIKKQHSEFFTVTQEFSFLQNALGNGHWNVFFQPVLNSSTGCYEFFEALFRFRNSRGDYVSIYPYLKTAFSTGLDENISYKVLTQARKFIDDSGQSVSVNISQEDIQRGSLIAILQNDFTQFQREHIIVEILEANELIGSEDTQTFFKQIRAMGIRTAIDDFGAGYSNYTQLLEFKVDYLKIDGNIIQQLEHNSENQKLIQGIVDFCHATGRKVVAEWIDRQSLQDVLSALGIDILQGYHIAKPMPMHEALALVHNTVLSDG